jgi:PhnB protein
MAKAKKSSAKKSAAKKGAAKKSAAKKKSAPAKKSAAKKSAAKKSAAKRAVAKKSAAKKSVAKRGVAKKGAAKKSAAKKSVAKKSVAKRAAAKKSVAKKRAPAKRAAAKKVSGVPAGFHTITPNLVFKDSVAAIEWYAKAFGAKETARMMGPDGKSVWHAELQIGDSMMYMNDESAMGAVIAPSGPKTSTAGMQLYVSDADAWASRAIEAGATVIMPIADMFWGDRMAVISDPFGHVWSISTRTKNMTEAEMIAAGIEFAKQFAAQQGGEPPPAAEAAEEPAAAEPVAAEAATAPAAAEAAAEPAAEAPAEPATEAAAEPAPVEPEQAS